MTDTSRDDHLIMYGTCLDTAKDRFRVQIEGSDTVIIASLAGKLRMNKIRILVGDRLEIAVSKYDLSRGIIKKRL